MLANRILLSVISVGKVVETFKIIKKLFDWLFSLIGCFSYKTFNDECNWETSVVKEVLLGRDSRRDNYEAITRSRMLINLFQ